MQKTIVKGISFNIKIFEAIEKKRGRINRSVFINDLLEPAVKEFMEVSKT